MILSFINICKVPREMLKTSGFALGFQHFPQDLANVNEWKIMSDPYTSNVHAQPSSGAGFLIFGRTIHLLSYFMWANSEGSSDTAGMHRLAWAFTGRLCDKYHNLMSWLKWASKNEGLFLVFENLRFYNPWKASSTTFLHWIR